jgi:hypothetical protein
MKKRIVPVALLSLVVAFVALAEQGAAPTIRQDGNIIQLTASQAFLKFVPVGTPVRLTLIDPRLGKTSVVGTPSRKMKNVLALTATGTLAFLPERGTRVVLSGTSADPASCLLPEFGIDCFGSFCAGTTYCLPGDGPGGFVCSCE